MQVPVVLALGPGPRILPLCSAIFGSISSRRCAFSRARVPSSSAHISRLKPAMSAARMAASPRSTRCGQSGAPQPHGPNGLSAQGLILTVNATGGTPLSVDRANVGFRGRRQLIPSSHVRTPNRVRLEQALQNMSTDRVLNAEKAGYPSQPALRRPSSMCAWCSGRIYGTRLRTNISNEAGAIVIAFWSASFAPSVQPSWPSAAARQR